MIMSRQAGLRSKVLTVRPLKYTAHGQALRHIRDKAPIGNTNPTISTIKTNQYHMGKIYFSVWYFLVNITRK